MKPLLLFLLLLSSHVFAKNPSVIIVGAGASGISAAAKLFENSITNVTILEAEDRIGGRIHTIPFFEGFIDLGAQYCHGENVVYHMVKDIDLLEHADLFSSSKLYYSNGSQLEPELTQEIFTIMTKYDDDIKVADEVSLGDAFLEKYNTTFLEKYKNDDQKFKIAIEAIRFVHSNSLMHEGAFDWHRPASGRHYKAVEGDQMMVWKKRGYDMILEVMLKRYPDPKQQLSIENNLILKKKVTKVIWNGDKVTVKSSDGSWVGDHVIFTPSVGVLAGTHEDVFEPQLPERKQEAIKAMGFDGIIKLIMHFPNPWWKEDDTSFFFLWSKEDLEAVKSEFQEGPSKDGISWVTDIVALVKVPYNPNVLIGWFSGELIPELEKASEDIVRKGSMYVIRKFLGKNYNITEADKVLQSQWHNNPNFRGTYSYEKKGYYKDDVHYQDRLAEPLTDKDIPRVLFAGEATHPIHYSTVHGAIESGRREAERIIKLHS